MDNADTNIIATRLKVIADQITLTVAGIGAVDKDRRGRVMLQAVKAWRHEMRDLACDLDTIAIEEEDATFGKPEPEDAAELRLNDAVQKLADTVKRDGYSCLADGIKIVAEAHLRR